MKCRPLPAAWWILLFLLVHACFPLAGPRPARAEGDLTSRDRITTANQVQVTVWTNGRLGSNFNTRRPSLEYPAGSLQDHLTLGGVWVGGIDARGDTLVSVAATTTRVGAILTPRDFWPLTDGFAVRSLIPGGPDYSPQARSEEDLVSACVASPAEEGHSACPIAVVQEVLSWNAAEPLRDFVIVRLYVTNVHPTEAIRGVSVGLWTELATGYKDPNRENWTSGWFRRKQLAYRDSLRLVMEHRWQECDGHCPSWAGIALLGVESAIAEPSNPSFNWWDWDPSLIETDGWRYQLLTNGEQDATDGIVPGVNDPVELLSTGPIGALAPGDTLAVTFAILGGSPGSGRTAEEDLVESAVQAREFYRATCVGWTPPAWTNAFSGPQLTVEQQADSVRLSWRLPSDEAADGVWIRFSDETPPADIGEGLPIPAGFGGFFPGAPGQPSTATLPAPADGSTRHYAAFATHRDLVITPPGRASIAVDRTPPELTLGVFQHPYLTEEVDLVLASSEELAEESVRMSVDETPLEPILLDPVEQIWMGHLRLESDLDSSTITACAADLNGNTTCPAALLATRKLEAKHGGVVVSADRQCNVTFAPETMNGDAHILILTTKETRTDLTPADPPGSHRISPGGSMRTPGTIELRYRRGDPSVDPSRLQIEQVGVGVLSSWVDPGRGCVSARVILPGEFRLIAGSSESPLHSEPEGLRLHDLRPNPTRGPLTVRFRTFSQESVRMQIFSAAGARVAEVEGLARGPGLWERTWNGFDREGRPVPCGAYYLRLSAPDRTETHPFLIVR